jgi:hypothetical protein
VLETPDAQAAETAGLQLAAAFAFAGYGFQEYKKLSLGAHSCDALSACFVCGMLCVTQMQCQFVKDATSMFDAPQSVGYSHVTEQVEVSDQLPPPAIRCYAAFFTSHVTRPSHARIEGAMTLMRWLDGSNMMMHAPLL